MNNKKNFFNKLFHNFSCENYSELASKSIDSELNLKESVFLKLHHALCLFCRRCKSQMEAIENACYSMAKSNDLNPSSKKLSEECKNKIKQEIE